MRPRLSAVAALRRGRRAVLGMLAGLAAACGRAARAMAPEAAAPQPHPMTALEPLAAPPRTTQRLPPAEPALSRLGVEGVVQPFWSADGSQVLYYDQPAPGLGGTWAVAGEGGAPERMSPRWGWYDAQRTLLWTPRPAARDTHVLHLPSGREWTLPSSNAMIFSRDGTVVAYGTAAMGQPGGPPPAPGAGFGAGPVAPFQLSNVMVGGADGQGSRRVQLPINGSVVAWLPGLDGAPNARLLLSGRRAERDHPALLGFDLRDRSAIELVYSRRVVGTLVSPDGAWVSYVAMWNDDPAEDGLWVARTDGSLRRRLDFVGSYRWTEDGRLFVLPVRASAEDGHEVWEAIPSNGVAQRLTDPAQTPFRVANFDWDLSPDGTQIVFVSADDRGLWRLSLPPGISGAADVAPPSATASGAGQKPHRPPFATPPGPSTWYSAHWYGVTTGGYRGRNSVYSQGQGTHFGIDFAARCGTEVVAVAPGRVIAVDGDYGSPPHNVVLQLYDGNQAMYGHLIERSRHVQVGHWVETGQVVGNTGDSVMPYNCTRNPHLHLEIRKGGRAIATNPTLYIDLSWDDATLGIYPGPRFERDLDNPRRHQFLDDQPDIWFGGPIITNFARSWPP